MGHHDPLDGYLTAREIVERLRQADANPRELDPVLQGFRDLCTGKDWTTSDPLGLGGLLFDAARISQLATREPTSGDLELLSALLEDTREGLASWLGSDPLHRPAAQRLAFRELGLSIGFNALPIIKDHISTFAASGSVIAEVETSLHALERAQTLAREIEDYWLQPAIFSTPNWQNHREINSVMLATSLLPEVVLTPETGPN